MDVNRLACEEDAVLKLLEAYWIVYPTRYTVAIRDLSESPTDYPGTEASWGQEVMATRSACSWSRNKVLTRKQAE